MEQTNINASEFNSAAGRQSSSSELLGNLDLRIEIGFMETIYYGTSEQLAAEGLIPAGFEWPRGRDRIEWVANELELYLTRCRPPGHKGLMRTWLEVDWWFVRVRPVERPDGYAIADAYKQVELAALARELSAEGRAAKRELDRCWNAAFWDKSFQAFKERVPGLSTPRRPRRKKAASSRQG